jgi:hypothetical protein
MNDSHNKKVLLTVYFLFYYVVFVFFFINHRLLSQFQPIFFNYNRDLSELLLVATGLPRYMIGHPWTFTLADGLLYLLPIPLITYAIRQKRFSAPLGMVFSLFLAIYLLLANIFWQNHHEPFILYWILSLAFITNRETRFYRLLKGARYYFCYIFFSAAVWKIARGGAFNIAEMSNILLAQHADILKGASPAAHAYAWLIDHPAISYAFYLAGVVSELAFIVGFFTRRYDRLLLLLAILFVAADLFLMRIPYWTVLMGGITLWLGPHTRKAPKAQLLIYETTHHENLPALLDLAEAHFTKVAVFLKTACYRSISGQTDPAVRWPRTEFVLQTDDRANRKFIAQLFSFREKYGYSHLHLSTLDNNLLLFALRLCALPPSVHVSLTVHEIGEYFAWHFHNLRDITESLAKMALHRRIHHYSFFLPAMARRFQQQLPDATAVFIPSRFYTPAAAGPDTTPASPFTIVIPGTVESNRRNYDNAADFLASYLRRPAPPPRPIQLVLLGNSDTTYGNVIVERFKRLESEFFKVCFYKGHIPGSEYERQLSAADLLWSPLRVHKVSIRNAPETYGLTTASGLTADILLNSTPALVPDDFIISEPFREAIFPYRSQQEWERWIDRLAGDATYTTRLHTAIHASFSRLTKEGFGAAFRTLMALQQDPR